LSSQEKAGGKMLYHPLWSRAIWGGASRARRTQPAFYRSARVLLVEKGRVPGYLAKKRETEGQIGSLYYHLSLFSPYIFWFFLLSPSFAL
jgi:hypothetical protein